MNGTLRIGLAAALTTAAAVAQQEDVPDSRLRFTEVAVAPALPDVDPPCALVDLDGDGRLDVFVGWTGSRSTAVEGAAGVWLSRPDGAFEAPPTSELTSPGRAAEDAAWADFDGDGDLDVFLLAPSTSGSQLLLNRGDGTFAAAAAAFPGIDGVNRACALAGDVDADGRPDVLALVGRSLHLFRQLRGLQFVRVTEAFAAVSPPLDVQDAELVDFDADGDLDVTLGCWSGVQLLDNDGRGRFRDEPGRLELVPGTGGPVRSSLAWADFDGDRDLDLLMGNDSWPQAPVSPELYRQDAGCFRGTPLLEPIVSHHPQVHAADLDGDGRPDFVAVASVNSSGYAGRNRGDGRFERLWLHSLVERAAFPGSPNGEAGASALGDVDGDGDPDLLLARTSRGPGGWHLLLRNDSVAAPASSARDR